MRLARIAPLALALPLLFAKCPAKDAACNALAKARPVYDQVVPILSIAFPLFLPQLAAAEGVSVAGLTALLDAAGSSCASGTIDSVATAKAIDVLTQAITYYSTHRPEVAKAMIVSKSDRRMPADDDIAAALVALDKAKAAR